jgi:glycosyltransferase involved in cell wall biosynthesis
MSRPTDTVPALHVLTLTPFFPSDRNEVSGCFVAEPIEHFSQYGIDSTVIAVSPTHHPRKHSTSFAPGEWIRYPQFPGTLGLSSAGKPLYARLLRRIRKLHRTHPIHLIHAHAALPCGHAAMLLSRHLDIPYVVTVHGLDVFNTCHLDGIAASWRRKVTAEVYRTARTVVCISGKVQDILQAGMPAEISSRVVHNGVNPNLFSPDPAAAARIDAEILTVGMLLPSKGHDLVLRALAKLNRSFPQLRCRIIGEGSDRVHLQVLAHELGVAGQVEFIGRQSRSEVADAMRRCSVFALPSRDEALGCVYLEAMSCAKPVIACQGQGITEVVEHGKNGWLIPAGELADLVDTIATLLRSPELCERIGAAARQTILESLTLSHQAQQLAVVYGQAIS